MNSTAFEIPHGEGNPRNSEGSFVQLGNGDILFAYTQYCGKTQHDGASANIVGRISSDKGISWGEPFLIVKNDALNVMSVSLLRLQDGRIAMVYCRKSTFLQISEDELVEKELSLPIDCRPWFCTSSDEGKTWSKPVDVAGVPFTYLCVNNDRMVQLKNGRLIIPAAYHWPRNNGMNMRGVVFCYISDDAGATWHESNGCGYAPVDVASGLREPGVIELEDGRLLGWARSDAGFQFTAYSSDNGENWTQPQVNTNFTSPDSPLSIKRNPASHELFAIWSDTNPRWNIKATPESWWRTPLVLARSNDEGKNWQAHQMLECEPDHGYCYTAIFFTDDNAVLLAYCCGGGDCWPLQNIRIRRIELGGLEPLQIL